MGGAVADDRARAHDGADIKPEPDLTPCCARLAAAHDRIVAQGDIEALVLRRKRGGDADADGRRLRRRHGRLTGGGLGDERRRNGRRSGDMPPNPVAVQRGMKISGARAGGAPLIV